MLDSTDPQTYFRELRELSRQAGNFPWSLMAEESCRELAEELKYILERWEAENLKSCLVEYFLREMLAHCFPEQERYYTNNLCVGNGSIHKQSWLCCSVLYSIGFDQRPRGLGQAALSVCTSIGAACKKALVQLHLEESYKDPSCDVTLPLPRGVSLVVQAPSIKRKVTLSIVAGTDKLSPKRR